MFSHEQTLTDSTESSITTRDRQPIAPHTKESSREERPMTSNWLGVSLIMLGFGVALIAILGPLILDLIHYHLSDDVLGQVVGGDAVALFLIAPVSIGIGVLALRRHRAAPLLALGPALFAAYIYFQMSMSDPALHSGNSENFFFLHVGLVVLAGLIAVGAWQRIDPTALPTIPRRMRLGYGWLTLAMAAFLVLGLHLPGLIGVWTGNPPPSVADAPTAFWLVKVMDFSIVLPALLGTAIGALRDKPWAGRALYASVTWFALLGSSVAGMAVVMQVRDDPEASLANVLVMSAASLLWIGLATVLYRPMFKRR